MDDSSHIHCIQYFPVIKLEDGGVIRFFLDICLLLSQQGVKVTILTQDDTDVPDEWVHDDSLPDVCTVEKSESLLGLLSKKSIKRVESLLSEEAILHLHVPWLVSNLQLSKLAKLHRVPYVITPHGSLDAWSMAQKKLKKLVYWKLFAKKMFDDSAFIHFTATGEREQAKQYLGSDRIKIIPCAFDVEAYDDLPDVSIALNKYDQISLSKPNILFLSRLHPKKGVDVLIEVTRILVSRSVELNVIIAGPSDETERDYSEQLYTSVQEHGLNNCVHFIGMVKGVEKTSLYRASDVFVLPTQQENFGLVLVESMICETSVITTYNVDIWKEIKEGGAIIVNNSAVEIADKLEVLLRDKVALEDISKKSRQWVKSYLSPKKIGSQYIAMYKNALNT